MDKIAEKASKNIIELKKKRPKEAFGKFISDIISGSEDFGGIAAVISNLDRVQKNIDDFKSQIENKTKLLTRNILSAVKSALVNKLSDLTAVVEKGNEVSGSQISKLLNEITTSEMTKYISRTIGEIIGQNLNLVQEIALSAKSSEIHSAGITQRYTEVEHQYVEAVVDSRDPRGIIEHVCSWFGKEYSTISYEKRTKTERIENGTNVEDVIDEVLPQVEGYVNDTVKENMENIAETFFKPQEMLVSEIRNSAGELSTILENFRKKII